MKNRNVQDEIESFFSTKRTENEEALIFCKTPYYYYDYSIMEKTIEKLFTQVANVMVNVNLFYFLVSMGLIYIY